MKFVPSTTNSTLAATLTIVNLVWGETASAYEFSVRAVELLTREWLEILRRDRSHPSIVTWVPVNESWGVQDIATDPAQQAFVVGRRNLTRVPAQAALLALPALAVGDEPGLAALATNRDRRSTHVL